MCGKCIILYHNTQMLACPVWPASEGKENLALCNWQLEPGCAWLLSWNQLIAKQFSTQSNRTAHASHWCTITAPPPARWHVSQLLDQPLHLIWLQMGQSGLICILINSLTGQSYCSKNNIL